MDWREKWEDKTRGGFEVVDVRSNADGGVVACVWTGSFFNGLGYCEDGSAKNAYDKNWDLLS